MKRPEQLWHTDWDVGHENYMSMCVERQSTHKVCTEVLPNNKDTAR